MINIVKNTILFVDDSIDARKTAEMLLASLNCEVLLADSGEKAIEFLKSDAVSEIDLIFLDFMMPGLDGLEVLEFMKNSNIKIPTIIQSGFMDSDHLKIAKDLGAVDSISKPYKWKDLKRMINAYSKESLS